MSDLLAVQEVRWLGRNITEMKDCKICYICDDPMFLEQALLLVSNSDQRVINFIAIDRRMCVFRIRSKLKIN